MFEFFHDIKRRLRDREQDEPLSLNDRLSPDQADDQDLADLIQELRSLGDIEVPKAARERTRAQVITEYQKHVPVKGGARGRAPGGFTLGRRSLVATYATMATLVVAFLAFMGVETGAFQAVFNRGPNPPHTVVSVPSSTTTQPDGGSGSTTSGSGATSTGPGGPSSTVPGPGEGDSGTTLPTGPVGSTDDVGAGGSSTTNSSTPPPPRTTQPPTSVTTEPSTTTSVLYTRQQRETSARTAVNYLVQLVISGRRNQAATLVSGQASQGLVQLVASLKEPYLPHKILSVSTSDPDVRVRVEIPDYERDDQRQRVVVKKTFMFVVTMTKSGAVITGIYAG